MLSLWAFLNEEGLNVNGNTPPPPEPCPSLEEVVAVGAELHTWGFILQEAAPPEVLVRAHCAQKHR